MCADRVSDRKNNRPQQATDLDTGELHRLTLALTGAGFTKETFSAVAASRENRLAKLICAAIKGARTDQGRIEEKPIVPISGISSGLMHEFLLSVRKAGMTQEEVSEIIRSRNVALLCYEAISNKLPVHPGFEEEKNLRFEVVDKSNSKRYRVRFFFVQGHHAGTVCVNFLEKTGLELFGTRAFDVLADYQTLLPEGRIASFPSQNEWVPVLLLKRGENGNIITYQISQLHIIGDLHKAYLIAFEHLS